jgi:hypothetical protein
MQRYNGRPSPSPSAFLPEMEEACEIIERTVNEEIKRRGEFFPLEWPATEEHPWKANVAAANCYTGSKETVGFHSDQCVSSNGDLEASLTRCQINLLRTLPHNCLAITW